MKDLDLTVLFVDTIPARIYLALLKKHGYRPKKILSLDIEPVSGKYQILRRYFGRFIATTALRVFKRYSESRVSPDLSEQLLKHHGLTLKCLKDSLESYTEGPVETISVNGLDDSSLVQYLKSSSDKAILFTGGGLLKEPLLSLDKIRFIHIHPGIVPEVKGADGLFWSLLLRGKPGYSAFYMNPGIDTGDIIVQQEFKVDLSCIGLENYGNDEVYRALLDFYDPCFRIMTFIHFLNTVFDKKQLMGDNENLDLRSIPSKAQNPAEGRTYFFMHRSLRNFVIDGLKNRGGST
ncbi:formyltransferase family protein [Marinobacter sp.]|uniref:formyltransferase family protein n=1 Tax=Marinobacter sp. TaxID=50741 RepID=UPI003A94B43C